MERKPLKNLVPALGVGVLAFCCGLQVYRSGGAVAHGQQQLPWRASELSIFGLSLGMSSEQAGRIVPRVRDGEFYIPGSNSMVRTIEGHDLTTPSGQLKAGDTEQQVRQVLRVPPNGDGSPDRLVWQSTRLRLSIWLSQGRVQKFVLHQP